MNILIAMDSFKGSLTSRQAGEAVRSGLSNSNEITADVISVSDGGEGSLDAIYDMIGGVKTNVVVQDAFHKEMSVCCLLVETEGKRVVYIESARVIGLHNHKVDTKTVEIVSSYGLGQLLDYFVKMEMDEIVVFLGGTITTDGGLGILQALGVDIYDKYHKVLPTKQNPLLDYAFLDEKQLAGVKKRLKNTNIKIACDVHNTYCGKHGAAYIFAGQKGASIQQIKILDEKLERFDEQHPEINLQNTKGSGAAGGIAGMLVLLGGKLCHGFDVINNVINISSYVEKADLVFTGEGSIDHQSDGGKLPQRMAELANSCGVPIVALCGKRESELPSLEGMFSGVFAIQMGPVTMDEAIRETSKNLTVTTQNIMHLLRSFI